MKVSFITTVFNEEKTIERLFTSLINQTKKPDEIIIVDGGSIDSTIAKIKNHESRIKKKNITIKVFVKPGNRSVGRNEAIKQARGTIIACSDSGNILDKNWLNNITKPFAEKSIDVVAGYYKSKAETIFQKCVVPYALVMEDKIDPYNFLPATRSVAFTKKIWKKIGGFNESLSHNEDYVFARQLKKSNAKMTFAKDAIVYWLPRKNLKQTFIMMYRFALGDAEANIWRPKVVLVFVRYCLGLLLFIFAPLVIPLLFIMYIIWAAAKNYRYVKNMHALYLLPIIQFTADFAVLSGTIIGLLRLITGKKITVIVKE